MNKSSSGFVHSVKVPRLYKIASNILKKVVEEGGSLKNLVYSSSHKNIKGIYALVVETIKHSKDLDKILKSSNLLKKESRLEPWLARILITELIFGKRELKGDSKPVKTILSYKKQFENLLKNCKSNIRDRSIVKKPRYVRVNTLQITPDEIIKIFRSKGWFFIPPCIDYSEFLEKISNLDDYSFTRDFHIKELLVFPGNIQLYNDELYKNGSILLQDKASCLPAFLLNPTPNSITLDMCAAPGMKTTHLSAIMRNKGKIFSAELDPDRYNNLCNMIQSAGCANVIPINKDSLKLDVNDKTHAALKDVEYILVDPSCSGSGIVERNNIFSKDKYRPKRLKKLCRFQFRLLKHALTNFPKVKRVVYSTCSVLSIENEQVVEDVLNKLNSEVINENEEVMVQEKMPKFKMVEPLKESWPRRGSNEFQHGKFCLYSDPKKDLTNGFFVAVFERVDDDFTDVKFEKTNKLKKKGKKTNEKRTEGNENIFHK